MNNHKNKIQFDSYNDGQAYRICPHCHKKKLLSAFGLRKMSNGVVRNQSWCCECRGKYN